MISHQEIFEPDFPAPYQRYYAQLIEFYNGRAHWEESVSSVPLPAIYLFCIHWLHAEVCNGGFHQFFFNSTGMIAPEARDGFSAAGMPEIADIVSSAMHRLGEPYPFERETRQALVGDLRQDDASGRDTLHDASGRDTLPDFDDLDSAFYKLIDTRDPFDGLPKYVSCTERYAKNWLSRPPAPSPTRS